MRRSLGGRTTLGGSAAALRLEVDSSRGSAEVPTEQRVRGRMAAVSFEIPAVSAAAAASAAAGGSLCGSPCGIVHSVCSWKSATRGWSSDDRAWLQHDRDFVRSMSSFPADEGFTVGRAELQSIMLTAHCAGWSSWSFVGQEGACLTLLEIIELFNPSFLLRKQADFDAHRGDFGDFEMRAADMAKSRDMSSALASQLSVMSGADWTAKMVAKTELLLASDLILETKSLEDILPSWNKNIIRGTGWCSKINCSAYYWPGNFRHIL
jgi:hypothetical protein